MPTLETQVVQISAKNIRWHGVYNQRTGRWLGVCPALNLNAVGDTWSELQECANEAMALLFADLFETGELQAFLTKNGWKVAGQPVPGTMPRFDVPADWQRADRLPEMAYAHA